MIVLVNRVVEELQAQTGYQKAGEAKARGAKRTGNQEETGYDKQELEERCTIL